MKVIMLFLGLLIATSSIPAFAQELTPAESSSESARLKTARQAVRCSIVYGMAGGNTKNESMRTELVGLQKTMMLAAPKLGATNTLMQEWLDEFDQEVKSASRSDVFWSKQIEVCMSFFDNHGDALSKLVSQR